MARINLGQLVKFTVTETDNNSLIIQESISPISLIFIAIFLSFATNIIGSIISFRLFLPQGAKKLEIDFFGFNFEIISIFFMILWVLVIFYIIYRLIRKRTIIFNNNTLSMRDVIIIPILNYKTKDILIYTSLLTQIGLYYLEF